MPTNFTPTLLPLTSIRLGRLLLNRTTPHESYHDPPNTPDPLVTPQKNYYNIISSTSTTTLRTCLTKLLSARYNSTQTANIDLSATEAYTYSMDNSTRWFRDACGDEAVREWLQEAVEDGDSVYLVVGFHTVVDAVVAVNDKDSGGLGGSATEGELLGVEVGRKGGTVQRRGWLAEGEQVYAVQYRKIGFKWFSSKVEKGVLGKNRWRVCFGRGKEYEEDSVEVVLEEEQISFPALRSQRAPTTRHIERDHTGASTNPGTVGSDAGAGFTPTPAGSAIFAVCFSLSILEIGRSAHFIVLEDSHLFIIVFVIGV
ncbi:hypothetical protein P167DRAFT_609826 [Morchella conica CCBAS932]|uniref:Uncharacterized protein n=1 Tax=Morchella conica CCBAS932 TaxID=1392247 RepID=A0A3N4KBL9_9PEZI|nr:hypothetical protein P167DRAFT_609826 [Morchella conica CCBAS932]